MEAHKGAAEDSSIVEDVEQVLYYGVGVARRVDTQQYTREWPVHLASITGKQCATASGVCVHGTWANDSVLANERRATYR